MPIAVVQPVELPGDIRELADLFCHLFSAGDGVGCECVSGPDPQFRFEPIPMDADILIIDRDAEIRKLLLSGLASEGIRVHGADGLADGKKVLSSCAVDLVVVEVSGGGAGPGGQDILGKIRKMGGAFEIIALCADAGLNHAIETLRGDGVFDYFPKPLSDESAFLASVVQAVEKSNKKSRRAQRAFQMEARLHELREHNRILRKAQGALLKSDSRFRIISSISTDYFYALAMAENRQLTFEWIGGAFHGITGLQVRDIGRFEDYQHRIHQEDQSAMKHALKTVFDNKKATVEYRFHSDKRGQLWLSDTMCPNWDKEKQRVVGIIGAVRDVTKTRVAEKNLRESEARREMANLAGQVGVWDWDIDSDVFHIDKSIRKALGYTEGNEPVQEELPQKIENWLRLIHPEDLPDVLHQVEGHIEGDTPFFETTLRMVHKKGDVRWFLARGTAIRNDHGKAVRMLGTETDITRYKRVEDRLRRSEHRYRQLIESSPIPILIHCDGMIVLLNHMAAHTLGGGSANQFLGRKIWEFVHEAHRDRFRQRIRRVLDGQATADFTEERFVRLDGESIDVSVAGTAVDHQGKAAVQTTFYDITDRKKLEERVSHSRKMQAIGELAGGIAHELNNALASVLGNVELLQMDSPDPDITDPYLNPIKASTKRMSNLANQLLAYARGGKYKPKAISVPQFMETTLPVLSRSIDPDMKIQVYIERNVSPIEVDLAQLQMSLFSVIENAHEALTDGGSIHIRVGEKHVAPPSAESSADRMAGNYVCIEIEDDGQGMDEKTLKRIFDPFFSTKFLGRGLGMAAVYGIVKNHGGWVTVDSTLGRGTKVTIYLPALSEAEEGCRLLQRETPKGSGTLLIVEDEADLITVSRVILTRLGYTILEATSGRTAISLAKTYSGDIRLALLDIKLPDMEGHIVYPELKALRPEMKVILCTGYSIDGPTREILDAGADDFLQKPFTVSQLAEKVKSCLGDAQ